jgi:plastocyanin
MAERTAPPRRGADNMKQKNNRSQKAIYLYVLFFSMLIGFGVFMFIARTQSSNAIVRSNTCRQSTCIDITSSGLRPDSVAVRKGDTVQFNTKDGQLHNFGIGGGSDHSSQGKDASGGHGHEHFGEYASGDFGADQAWRVQFKQTGTYMFHDHYNPNLNVLVVVYGDK